MYLKRLFRSVKESKEADDDENFFESWHDMNCKERKVF